MDRGKGKGITVVVEREWEAGGEGLGKEGRKEGEVRWLGLGREELL